MPEPSKKQRTAARPSTVARTGRPDKKQREAAAVVKSITKKRPARAATSTNVEAPKKGRSGRTIPAAAARTQAAREKRKKQQR